MSGYKNVGGDIVGSIINGEQLEVAKDLVLAVMVVGVVLDVAVVTSPSIAVSWWFCDHIWFGCYRQSYQYLPTVCENVWDKNK